jgi:hypothetical protein
MQLTSEQTDSVRQWVAAGLTLADIQKRLITECGVACTYRDVKFLVDDLDLALADTKPAHFQQRDVQEANAAKAKAQQAAAKPAAPGANGAEVWDDEDDFAAEASAPHGGGVTVTVDKLTRPGAVISGSVTFSDGVTANWYLDQMGRLGLAGAPTGYQPTRDDVAAFQRELQKRI